MSFLSSIPGVDVYTESNVVSLRGRADPRPTRVILSANVKDVLINYEGCMTLSNFFQAFQDRFGYQLSKETIKIMNRNPPHAVNDYLRSISGVAIDNGYLYYSPEDLEKGEARIQDAQSLRRLQQPRVGSTPGQNLDSKDPLTPSELCSGVIDVLEHGGGYMDINMFREELRLHLGFCLDRENLKAIMPAGGPFKVSRTTQIVAGSAKTLCHTY
jgi:hypothetical protein